MEQGQDESRVVVLLRQDTDIAKIGKGNWLRGRGHEYTRIKVLQFSCSRNGFLACAVYKQFALNHRKRQLFEEIRFQSGIEVHGFLEEPCFMYMRETNSI